MDLKKVRKVTDSGDRFIVEHETHGTFPVLKKGLSKFHIDKIQALARGGQVRNYDDGGDVAPMDTAPLPGPNDDLKASLPQPATLTQPQPTGLMSGSVLNATPGAEWSDNKTPPPPAYSELLKQTPPTEATETPPVAAPQAEATIPSVPQAPQLPSGAPIFKDIDAQAAALRQGAEVTAKEEAEKQQKWQEYSTQSQTRLKAFEDSMKAQSADYDKRLNDVANSTVNPNRLYQNMGTGGQIASAIAIAMSGFGTMLASGGHNSSNSALDIINKAIDRDIDAQKVELGKKQTLLGDNLRKTNDLREAEIMTRAQRLSDVQGQIIGISAKYGGDKARANADFLASRLAQQRDTLKYNIALQHSNQAAQQTQQQQQIQAYSRLAQGTGTPADEIIVGDKVGARVVETPTGRAIAHDPKAAEKYREESVSSRTVRDIIGKIQAGWQSGASLDPAKRGQLEADVKMLQLELPKALAGVNRLNERELAIAQELATNPTHFWQFSSHNAAAMDALGTLMDNKLRQLGNTYLIQPSIRAIPGR